MRLAIVAWLGRALSDGVSNIPSVKRLSFFLTICVLIGGATCALVGALLVITIKVQQEHLVEVAKLLSDLIESMVLTAASAVTGGYLGGKAIERKPADPPEQNNPPAQ